MQALARRGIKKKMNFSLSSFFSSSSERAFEPIIRFSPVDSSQPNLSKKLLEFSKAQPKTSSHHKLAPVMLENEHKLPKVPLPSLHATMEKCLASMKPFASSSEFKELEKLFEDFIRPGGVGQIAQKKLEARAAEAPNWLTDWWLYGYLGIRTSLPFSSSYLYGLQDKQLLKNPVTKAAVIISCWLLYKDLIDARELSPEVAGQDIPFEMSSSLWLFHASRIPKREVDEMQKFESSNAPHVIIARKNRLFVLKYEHEDGTRLSTSELATQLQKIYDVNDDAERAYGSLTILDREDWASARSILETDSSNSETLRSIDSSAFFLALDDVAPKNLVARCRQYWHGNGKNRWFDKPCQLFICENGALGFLAEHTMIDGQTSTRALAFISALIDRYHLTDANLGDKVLWDKVFPRPQVSQTLPEPKEIEFNQGEKVDEYLRKAEALFKSQRDSNAMEDHIFYDIGKNTLKKLKCSPDAFVQMAIQLAYYKKYNISVGTYEAASTRRYLQGRTETVRVVTQESVEFCKAMTSSNRNRAECIRLLTQAMKTHSNNAKAAALGAGCDRHLFGLSMIDKNVEQTPLFQNKIFQESKTWKLSTSHSPVSCANEFAFGTVQPDGYGVAYMILDDMITLAIAARADIKTTNAAEFLKLVKESIYELYDLLKNQDTPKL